MKRLLLIGAGILVSGAMSAQKMVSKDASNKTVVLEEFTGKTCGYCPDGHKRADELAAQNPGKVTVINIHCGSYASGTPNYRVMEGSQEYGKVIYQDPYVGLTGFPSGMVNRNKMGTSKAALSRTTWANHAGTIMGESSPVNVGVSAMYDEINHKIVLYVEGYYTGDAKNATNKLNVGLLQDNILGPQSGGSNFYPAMMENGKYRHMKMLRAVLTGQWGEDISNTVSGGVFAKVYEWDVQDQIGDVSTNWEDMAAYVFVAEDNWDIQAGAKSKIVKASGAIDVAHLQKMADMVVNDPTNSELLTFNPSADGGLNVLSVDNVEGQTSFRVFPNPTENFATVELGDLSKTVSVKVVAVTGQVMDIVEGTGSVQVDLSNYNSGYYFLEVSDNNGVVARERVLRK